MPVTINRVSATPPKTPVNTKPKRKIKSKKTSKTAPQRGTFSPRKNPSVSKLKSLETTLEKFHKNSDHELLEAIQPPEGDEDKHSYRLEEDQREARLVLLHRLMIRKIPHTEIAKQLGISVPMYYKLRDQLQARMRLDVSRVDVPYLIGDSLAFYDEIRAMALTMASSTAVKSPQAKCSAMAIALRTEKDKNDFLVQCGVYSAPVVEHIVRGMVSTGNYSVVDGDSQRVTEAGEVNAALASHLKAMIANRILSVADTCKSDAAPVGG